MAQFLIALGVLSEDLFNSQHPYDDSHLSETTVLGYLFTSSSGLGVTGNS